MKRKFGILKRASWLRPFYSDYNEMVYVSKKILKKKESKPVVLNMMFHNVEIMTGLNPYTTNNRELSKYLDALKNFFIFCKTNKIQPATLSRIQKKFLEDDD